ncbi:hypothetical protein QP027_08035 [Corynebacterium breve]|uniref:Uncharacterized protein n=1 Tax=Corynebacterium breve TaxID=3049799 RepID=A0ABY8VEL7_9CORY|nr:hypothetical protein [Corynebacterium breve]WIM67073.1 hypothetical protein QP027_08035 [Corynebacterium breve]
MDKAGIFTGGTGGKWVWEGNELFDAHTNPIALVRSDVLLVGEQRLLIEYSPGPQHFVVRATSVDGTLYRVSQKGFTVSQLEGECDGRHYALNRNRWWSKQRNIVNDWGDIVATVNPLISGRVEVLDGPAIDDVPTLDLVFLTWALVLVDSPVRQTLT